MKCIYIHEGVTYESRSALKKALNSTTEEQLDQAGALYAQYADQLPAGATATKEGFVRFVKTIDKQVLPMLSTKEYYDIRQWQMHMNNTEEMFASEEAAREATGAMMEIILNNKNPRMTVGLLKDKLLNTLHEKRFEIMKIARPKLEDYTYNSWSQLDSDLPDADYYLTEEEEQFLTDTGSNLRLQYDTLEHLITFYDVKKILREIENGEYSDPEYILNKITVGTKDNGDGNTERIYFIGYGNKALAQLGQLNILQAVNNVDSTIELEAEGPGYTARFDDSWALRINPKDTMAMQTKILLNRIPEVEKDRETGEFVQKSSISGFPAMMKFQPIFEAVVDVALASEPGAFEYNLMKNPTYSNNNLIAGLRRELTNIRNENADKYSQMIRQLSNLNGLKENGILSLMMTVEEGMNPDIKIQKGSRVKIGDQIAQLWQSQFLNHVYENDLIPSEILQTGTELAVRTYSLNNDVEFNLRPLTKGQTSRVVKGNFVDVFKAETARIFSEDLDGETGSLTSKGYLNLAYVIKRILGIELAEGDWTDPKRLGFITAEALKNLNEVKPGNKSTYLRDYIKHGEIKSFRQLIDVTIGHRIVDAVGESVKNRTYNSETPFEGASGALDLLHNIFKSYHKSVENGQGRNVMGGNEHTRVPAEMFNHQVKELKTEYHLRQLQGTHIGKYNPFVNDQFFENLDTGKVEFQPKPYWEALNTDTISGIQLSRRRNKAILEARKAGLSDADILSMLYFQSSENSTKSKNELRENTRYYMPFGDSSAANLLEAPKYAFDFDVNNGLISLRAGEMRNRFYGLFKSEVNRASETLKEFHEVDKNPDLSTEDKMKLLDPNYHYFKVRDSILPGAGTRLYFWGKEIGEFKKDIGVFDTWQYADDKIYPTGLKEGIVNEETGELDDTKLRESFDLFFDQFITDQINIKMKVFEGFGNSMFRLTPKDYDENNSESNPTSPAFKSNIIGNSYLKTAIRLFGKTSTFEGRKLNDYNKAEYDTQEQANKEGYHNKLLLASVIDHQLNHMLAVTNLRMLTVDLAQLDETNNWDKFEANSYKRDKIYASPFTRTATSSKVKYIGYEDVRYSDAKVDRADVESTYTTEEAAMLQFMENSEVLAPFVTADKIPARYKELTAIYWANKEAGRTNAQIIRTLRDTLNSTITDGGTIITLKEFLFQQLEEGAITKDEYFNLYHTYSNPDLVMSPAKRKEMGLPALPRLKLKGQKMVAAGSYIDGARKVTMYMKDSKRILIPAMVKGTKYEAILRDLNALETGVGSQPAPGIQLVPRSALKMSNTRFVKLFDENGDTISNQERTNASGQLETALIGATVSTFPRSIYGRQVQNPDKGKNETKTSNQLVTNTFLRINDDTIIGFDMFASEQEAENVFLTDTAKSYGIAKKKLPPNGLTKREMFNSLLNISRELKEKQLQKFVDKFGLDYNIGEEWRNAYNEWLEIVKKDTGYKLGTTERDFERVVRNMKASKDSEARERGQELQMMKYELIVRNMHKMVQDIRQQAAGAKNVDVSQLRIFDEMIIHGQGINEIQKFKMSLTFSPGNKQYQQVVLAEIDKLIAGTRINGTSVVQAATHGSEQTDETGLKSKIKGDTSLKGYTLTYDSKGNVNGFSHAEIQMPWFFKDKSGRLLDYDTYVNSDGTPKLEMWDKEMLEIVGYRIPNTGMNMSGIFTISRFMHPSEGDVALIPDIIYSQWGADLDFDKMYNYVYHFEKADSGKLQKVRGVINMRQVNAEEIFSGEDNIERAIDVQLSDMDKSYRKRKADFDEAFRQYTENLQELRDAAEAQEEDPVDVEPEFNTIGKSSREIKKAMKEAQRLNSLQALNLIKEKFGDVELTPAQQSEADAAVAEYEKQYETLVKQHNALEEMIAKRKATFKMHEFLTNGVVPNAYLKLQSREQLENAYIDIFNMVMSDVRNLPTMLTPLTIDMAMDELREKRFNGKSFIDLVQSNRGVINSEAGQVGNSANMRSAAPMIGILATASETTAMMHTASLSLGTKYSNDTALEDVEQIKPIVFLNDEGEVITEPSDDHYISKHVNNENTIKGYKIAPMVLMVDGKPINIPNKLYTAKDIDGNIAPIEQTQSFLQAFLDVQKGPEIVYANYNAATTNAALILSNLGYRKQLVPFLQQEIIRDYAKAKLNKDSPFFGNPTYLKTIVLKYMEQAGLDRSVFLGYVQALGEGSAAEALDQTLIEAKVGEQKYGYQKFFNTQQMNDMIAESFGEKQKESDYALNQLHILRMFLRADKSGNDMFDMQQRLNLHTKGTKGGSLLAVQDQLSRIKDVANPYSFPNVIGSEKLGPYHSKNNKNTTDHPGNVSYNYLRRSSAFLLVNPEDNNMFSDFTPIFESIRYMLGGITGRFTVKDKERHNIHAIKYLLNDPFLFEDMLQDLPVAARKSADGIREFVFTTINKKGKKGGINEKTGLARSIEEIKNKIDPISGVPYSTLYPVLNVFKTKVQEGKPSWVYNFNTNQFKENMAHEVPYDIVKMLNSNNKDLNRIARFMYLYYYFGSSVTTPHSFGHMLPQEELFKPDGFADRLHKKMDNLNQKSNALRNEIERKFPKTYAKPDWFRPFDTQFISINKEMSNVLYNMFVQYTQNNPYTATKQGYEEGLHFEEIVGKTNIFQLTKEGQVTNIAGAAENVPSFMDNKGQIYVINRNYKTYSKVERVGANMYSEYSYGNTSSRTLIEKNNPEIEPASEALTTEGDDTVIGDSDFLLTDKKKKPITKEMKDGVPLVLDEAVPALPMLQWLFDSSKPTVNDPVEIVNQKRQMAALAEHLFPFLPTNMTITPYSIAKAKKVFGSYDGSLTIDGKDAYGLFSSGAGTNNIELAFDYMDKLPNNKGIFLRQATLHETSHAATVSIMNLVKDLNDGKLTRSDLANALGLENDPNTDMTKSMQVKQMQASYQNIINIYEMLKNNTVFSKAYAEIMADKGMKEKDAIAQLKTVMMANHYEMVAYLFSHDDFRKAMDKVPFSDKRITLLDRIKKFLRELLLLTPGSAAYNAFENIFGLLDVANTNGGLGQYTETYSHVPMSVTHPMATRPAANQNSEDGEKPFYMNSYIPELLESGQKAMSIRPEKLKPGVYKYHNALYRVTTRGLRKISQLMETKDVIRSRASGEANSAEIEQFYNDKLPMYIYDIKKVPEAEAATIPMTKEFMGPMAVENHKFTSSGIFDEYVAAVSDYITRLQDERKRVKGNRAKVEEYSSRIEQQSIILEQLKSNKAVRELVEIGIDELEIVKEFALSSDANYVELNEGLRIAKAWSNLTDLIDFNREGKDDAEVEVIDMAGKLQNDMLSAQTDIWNTMVKLIVGEAESKGINIKKAIDKNGKFIINDMSRFAANTISTAFSSNPLDQLIHAIQDKQDFVSQEETYQWVGDFDSKTKELLGTDTHAHFMLEDYDAVMFDETKKEEIKVQRRGIITMYDRSFYKEYDDMLAKALNREIKWKDFYAYERKHFEYTLTDEGKQDFEDHMAEIRERNIIDIDANNVPTYDEEAIEKERQRMDPAKFQEYLDNATGKVKPNSGAYWFTKTPKNIPINPKYAALTDKQKEYHEYFSNEYLKAYENSVFDYRLGPADIDQKLMDFTGDLVTGLGDNIKHIASRTAEMMKGWVMVKANGITSIKTTRTLTGQEHIDVPFKEIGSFVPENGKISPIEILKSFKQASVAFRHKKDVEEVMNTINDIATNAMKHETNNAGVGKIKTSGLPLLTSNSTNTAERLNYSIRTYLAGHANDPSTTNNKLAAGESGLSGSKMIDSINAFTRVRYMAFAPISAAGNFIMGAVNNFTYASSGEYFTDAELATATWHMKFSPFKFLGNKVIPDAIPEKTKLIAEIMYKYNLIGDITEELIYGESAINKLFMLQKGGEFLVQGASAVAQLLHEKVELTDGTKTTMFNLYKLEKGRAVFDVSKLKEDHLLRNPDYVQKIFTRIKLVNQKIHGDYSNAIMGKKTAFGRMLFLFRTWLPMAVKERFGGEYQHDLLGAQKGRYVSVRDLTLDVFRDADGKLGANFNKNAALNFGKIFAKMVLPIIGKRIKLGGHISDVDRRNIDMFVREVHMYVTIAMGVAMAKVSASADDDDDTKGMLNYLFNQGVRIQNELSMFYMPSSASNILGNLVPMSNTLIDAQKVSSALINYINDPKKDIYQRGFRKGHSKTMTAVRRFTPLVRSAESVWSSWSQMYNNPTARR